MAKKNEGGKPVASVSNGDGKKKAKSGKPRKITSSMMRAKTASLTTSLGHAGTIEGSGGNFYSPELSTDFLELPQSLHEQWNYYRFFYRSEPFVGQAVDLHTELPLSKIRIGIPEAKNRDLAVAATRFCTRWAKNIGLLHRLLGIVHERNLIGEVFIWMEEAGEDMPREIRYEMRRELTEIGRAHV